MTESLEAVAMTAAAEDECIYCGKKKSIKTKQRKRSLI